MPSVVLSGIKKTFDGFVALDDLSLDIADGEFVCFLGPSGCGKTTLLRIIAGLESQDGGTVAFDGRDVSTAPPQARDYGIVFQSYALFPNLSVARNVGYGIRTVDRTAAAERVAEMLALVGLPDAGPKFPGQLSGGQQQRIALARALAPAPRLLLLDEPLGALDARVRIHLRRQIRELHDRLGLTTIMVTHDQEEALTMADRIVIMNHGRIEQCGTPYAIYTSPESLFVTDFVGTMNSVPGVVTGTGRVRVGHLDLACGVDMPPGSAVTLCWRPEDMLIGGESGRRPLRATILSLEFLGPFHRARLRADDIDHVLTADIPANVVRALGLGGGMVIDVGLPESRLHLFSHA